MGKVCFKCGECKPMREFYRHSNTADGHLGKCMACTKNDVRKRYYADRPKVAAYAARAFKRPSVKRQKATYQRNRRLKHPEKQRAYTAVIQALKTGELVRQPCEECGAAKTEAHHEDYQKPLSVNWLCRQHHLARHGKETISS